jgi:hypothetical protein
MDPSDPRLTEDATRGALRFINLAALHERGQGADVAMIEGELSGVNNHKGAVLAAAEMSRIAAGGAHIVAKVLLPMLRDLGYDGDLWAELKQAIREHPHGF